MIDEERGDSILGRRSNLLPGATQIVQVPLQFLAGSAHTRGAHDRAHAVGDLQIVHRFAQLVAILTLDAARDAAGARIVRHQYQESARKTDEGRKGGALVAALFLFHLNDQFLPFLEQFLDVHPAAGLSVVAEIFAGDFLQRQKAVALSAEIDERGFEARLDPRDATFIDVGFFLFPGGNFNRQIVKLLAVHQSDAQLLCLSCVDKHSLHWPLLECDEGPRSGEWATSSCGGGVLRL